MNEKTRILIVDDDPHLLQGMSRILKSAGYETIEAATGTDCLRFTIEQKPDLVLLDVMLPDINGIEVCKRIKLDKTLADCYVVLLSSLRIGSDDQAEGLETGADGYIARPVSNRELLARVESLLRLKRAEEAIRKSEERFRRISSMTSDISYSCTKSNNAAYSIDWIMGAVEQITGHSADDVIALGCWRNLVFDEDLPIFDSKVLCLAPGTSASCELRLAHNTGKVVWVASFAECVLDSGSPDSLRLYGALVDITERKLAVEDLRESEEKFSKAFFLSPDAIAITRLVDGVYVSVNEGVRQSLGFTEEEVIGKTALELNVWDNPEDRNRLIEALKAKGKVNNFEARFRTKDGGIRYGLMSASIIELNGVEHILNVARDITDRKLAESRLAEISELNQQIIANSPVGIGIYKADGQCIVTNDMAGEILGATEAQVLSQNFRQIKSWQDSGVIDGAMKTLNTGQRTSENIHMVSSFGKDLWLSGFFSRIYLRDEPHLLLMFSDITDRKRAEDALAETNKRYRLIAETIHDCFWMATPDIDKIVYVSPAYETIWGRSCESLYESPTSFIEAIHPDDRDRVIDVLDQYRSQVTSWNAIYRIVLPDGSIRWVEDRGFPVPDENGKWYLNIGVATDITERKRAEEELLNQKQVLEMILDNVPAMIALWDSQGYCHYINRCLRETLGWSLEELEHHNIIEKCCPDPDYRDYVLNYIASAKGTWSDFSTLTRYGNQIDTSWANLALPDGSGVGIGIDITERVRAEKEQESLRSQLIQAQKMEAIGTLAGGVAHDFNNLLQIVLGYSQLLLIDKHPEHQDYDKLHTINTSAKRGADLVQRLMVFSRKGDTKPRSLNLNHEVTQLKKLLERTIPKMIAIELSLESWLPVINADPVQVEQILLNLAINAKDAMPESGGKLTIETRNITLDEEYCRMHLESKPGQYVMISVSDTGHGMSQETVQHIFEPFFTTKGEGKGTGLGLAMVYGIMKHHEGFINCKSEPGHGTTFRIYFPVVQTEVEEDLERESAIPQGGSETILLVDDEESLCDIGSQLLTRAGYTVLTATNARDALDLYGNQRGDISLVIMDLIMPEMGGKECFQELVNINPQVRVILSSGFLSDGTTEEARVFGFRGLVEKPYNMRQLLGMVRDVLDGD
jgi:PAS domain S-box-containing protein